MREAAIAQSVIAEGVARLRGSAKVRKIKLRIGEFRRSNSAAVSIGERALFWSWALPPASVPMLCIRCARRNCDL